MSSLFALLSLVLLAAAIGVVQLVYEDARLVETEGRHAARIDAAPHSASVAPASVAPANGGNVSAPAVVINVYAAENPNNPALSIFRTGMLDTYGTGRVHFRLVDHSRFQCHKQCLHTKEPLLSNASLVGEAADGTARGGASGPCVVATREKACKLKHLQCNYPHCKTLVTNDEGCRKGHFDAREYYTAEWADKGYLPLGPRSDAWASFQRTQTLLPRPAITQNGKASAGLGREGRQEETDATSAMFEVKKASERKYAFNAIFSQSTNKGRQRLASLIRDKENGNRTAVDPAVPKLEVFATMAKKWTAKVNSAKSKQLNTDDYVRVLFDSAFTLAPAGHNPECFRLYEALESGSIPIVLRKDVHTAKPCRGALRNWEAAPVVVLQSWDELYATVGKLMEDTEGLDGRQREVRKWYEGFMRERVREFEDFVLGNGKDEEVGQGGPVANATGNVEEAEREATTPVVEEVVPIEPVVTNNTLKGKVEEEATKPAVEEAVQSAPVANGTLQVEEVEKEATNRTNDGIERKEATNPPADEPRNDTVATAGEPRNDAVVFEDKKKATNVTKDDVEEGKDKASNGTGEAELDRVEKEAPSPTKPAVEDRKERTHRVRYILGHGTGHAGSTALQSALGKRGCPWETISRFEGIPTAARAYDYGSPTTEAYAPEESEALRAHCRPTLASFRRRLPERPEGDVAYLDMGHFHNRGRVLECLAAELKEDITFARTRRARYDIARSFAADLTTPCTGTKWLGLGKKVKKIGHPRVALCPRSTETGGLVNLPVSDEVWDSLSPFQRFLWYADELESRWHLLRATYDGPQYLEVAWSNSSELEQGVSNVRNALGCSAIDMVKNKKTHVRHEAGSLNCTDLIRQDYEYRRKVNYDETTDQVLFSQYSSSAYHGNIDDCMETEGELQRVLDSIVQAGPQEAKRQQVQVVDRVENESLNATNQLVTEQQNPDVELIQQLCAQQQPFSLAEYPPGKVNSMRRALAAENRSCYEHHFSAFSEYTRARLSKVKRHLSLHIPKAGGSSLCKLAKSTDLQTPKSNNCWEIKHGFPLWGIGRFKDRDEWTVGCGESPHCDEFVNAKVPAFTMNENYLDHPLVSEQRLYSAMLRDPVDRAMSQERHLEKFRKRKENKAKMSNSNSTVFDARLALARHNYMTWALAVAKTEPYRKRVLVSPKREHLKVAKETLSQFDFLLELSQNRACETATLKYMGFGGRDMGRSRASKGSKPEMSNDRDVYASWNSLDIELHRYARRLIQLDCEFFLRLDREGGIHTVQKAE